MRVTVNHSATENSLLTGAATSFTFLSYRVPVTRDA
jgi:hypothetical protein